MNWNDLALDRDK